MARISTALQIDGTVLKRIVEDIGTVESVAQCLGVSRQILSSWFSENKIPPRRLVDLTRTLSLSSQQIRALSAKKRMNIYFRTLRNADVSGETRYIIEESARTFFVLDDLAEDPGKTELSYPRIAGISDANDVALVASKIEKVLGVTKYPRTLEQIVLSLRRLGIPVIFYRFEEAWKKENVRAFTAEQNKRHIVFIDAMLPYEDALWHVVHEFCHLAVKEVAHSAKTEKLVTSIANEILTPTDFIRDVQPKVTELVSQKMFPPLVRMIEEAASFLGVSFEGFVRALQDASVIKKNSPSQRYLYGTIQKKKQSQRLSLEDLVFPKQERVKYWTVNLSEPSKAYILRLGALVREGVLSGQLSLGRAAELLGLDPLEMSELARNWTEENETKVAS